MPKGGKKINKNNTTLGGRIWRKVYKTMLWAFVWLIIFSILLIVLSQMFWFRSWITGIALDIANNELQAKIELYDLKINPFKGIEVEELCLLAAGDTIAYIPKAEIDIDLADLFDSKINIGRAVFESPRFKLLGSKDGTLNVEHIAYPGNDTSSGPPSPIVLNIDNFELVNARFIMIDSLYSDTLEHINFSNLDLQNLNILLDANIVLSSLDFDIDLKKVNFLEKKTGFRLGDLSCRAEFDTLRAEINKLHLTTMRSIAEISLSAKNFNLFGDLDERALNNTDIQFNIEADSISSSDFIAFSGLETELPEKISLHADISGSPKDIKIRKFDLRTGQSLLNFEGEIRNIIDFDNAEIIADFNESNIFYSDIPANIATGIPDFDNLNIKWFSARKTFSSLKAGFSLSCSIGGAEGAAEYDMKSEEYDFSISTKRLNLAPIIGDLSLGSSINAEIKAKGKHFDLSSASANIILNSNTSKISEYSYKNLYLTASLAGGEANIDTLQLFLNSSGYISDNSYFNPKPALFLSGNLDLNNVDNIKYQITSKFEGLNLVDIIKTNSAPEQLSGALTLKGSGFDPDLMNINVETDIYECSFGDRGLLPFLANIHLSNKDGIKGLELQSDFANLYLRGNYKFSNLSAILKEQISYLSEDIAKKTEFISQVKDTSYVLTPKLYNRFDPLELKLNAKIRDISPIASFMEKTELFCNANLDITLSVSESESKLAIDSLNINTFKFKNPDIDLLINPIEINGNYNLAIKDSLLNLSAFNISLFSDYDIDLNGLLLKKPYAKISLDNEKVDLILSSNINDLLDISSEGSVSFNKESVQVALDNIDINYQDIISWQSANTLIAELNANSFNIEQMHFKRKDAENIQVSGSISLDTINNVNLKIKDFPFNSINALIPEENREILNSIKGKLAEMNININGKLTSPIVDISLQTDDIIIDKLNAGYMSAALHAENELLTGELNIIRREKELLNIDLQSFPLNLSLTNKGKMVHNRKPFKVILKSSDMPAGLANPFLTDFVQNIKGSIGADLLINGTMGDDIDYKGKVRLKDCSFLLIPNNMNFITNADVSIGNETVAIEQVEIRNINRDRFIGLKKIPGTATVNGNIKLKDFLPEQMNFIIKSQGLKILSDASAKPMPSVYGDFVIATGKEPIKFSSSKNFSSVKGFLKVVEADLKMPQQKSTQSISTNVKYQEVDDNNNIIDKDIASLKRDIDIQNKLNDNNSSEKKPEQEEMNEDMEIDIHVSIPKPMSIDMVLGSFIPGSVQKLLADIGTKNQSETIRIYKQKGARELKLFGSLELKEGSKFSFYKVFDTYGTISFPTGNPENLDLDLEAKYSGKSIVYDEPRTYSVILSIKGSKDSPEIDFNYEIDGVYATGDSTQIMDDAVFLLLFGRTKEEFGTNNNGDVYSELGQEYLAGMISSLLNASLVGGTSVIESVDFEKAESWENSKLTIKGKVLGMDLKVGGAVADISNNYTITGEISFAEILDTDFLKNWHLAISTATNNTMNTTNNDDKVFELKIEYKKSW